VTRRVALATVEPELHLTLPRTWRANYHRVETTASMLFELVSGVCVSGGLGGLKNTRIIERMQRFILVQADDALRPTADDPYTQEHPKSGVTIECRMRFGRGSAGC
jgi:hypothetical protein